jgi:tRNA G18 (ribose-2'-O)-methylase SpoU
VIVLEQDEKALEYKEISEIIQNKISESSVVNKVKFLIIPGREVEGLEVKILEKADYIAEIPQYGQKESLNIFSSLAIVLYKWFDL